MMAYEWRHAFTRIQIEYIEMPDLKLTLAQIRRCATCPRSCASRRWPRWNRSGSCGARRTAASCAARSAGPAAKSRDADIDAALGFCA